MNRERFKRLLMGVGFSRNEANTIAMEYRKIGVSYRKAYEDGTHTVRTTHNLDITNEFALELVGRFIYYGGTSEVYVRDDIEWSMKYLVLLNKDKLNLCNAKIIEVRPRSINNAEYIITFEWTAGFKKGNRAVKEGMEHYLSKYCKMLSSNVAKVTAVQ